MWREGQSKEKRPEDDAVVIILLKLLSDDIQ